MNNDNISLIESLISGYTVMFEGQQEYERYAMAEQIASDILIDLKGQDYIAVFDKHFYDVNYAKEVQEQLDNPNVPDKYIKSRAATYPDGLYLQASMPIPTSEIRKLRYLKILCGYKGYRIDENGYAVRNTAAGKYKIKSGDIYLISPDFIPDINSLIKFVEDSYENLLHELIHAIDYQNIKYPSKQARKPHKKYNEDTTNISDNAKYMNTGTEVSAYIVSLITILGTIKNKYSIYNLKTLYTKGPYAKELPADFSAAFSYLMEDMYEGNRRAFAKRLMYMAKKKYDQLVEQFAADVDKNEVPNEQVYDFFDKDKSVALDVIKKSKPLIK